MKYITKTHEHAKRERERSKGDNICPKCKKYCIGTVTTNIGGLFSKTKRMNNYSCFKCGTEWNTGWKEV